MLKADSLKPELIQEFVGKAHGDLEVVQRLLGQEPGLLNAAWDWGGRDWETPLGAATHIHMGRKRYRELPFGTGFLFAAAMLGKLEIVKAMINDNPKLKNDTVLIQSR